MKRILAILLLMNFFAAAQDTATQNTLTFSGGVSFPIGDFASAKMDKINSGMAATGYNLEIKYNHQFNELFGFATAISYNRHRVRVPAGNQIGIVNPWTWYQILFGPMITGQIGQHISLDVSAYTGSAFINAPKVNLHEQVIAKKYSATAIPLKVAVDARIFMSERIFLFAGADYTYLHANFNLSLEAQDLSFKQRMNTLAVNAGMGLRL